MLSKVTLITACLIQVLVSIALADSDGFNIESTKVPMSTMLRSSAINGKRFVFVTFMPASWYRAAHVCKFNGMQLAALNSVEEHNAIVKLAEATGIYATYGFWTAGNDLGLQNNWYWLATGKPLKYTNWKVGEPNNFNKTNERCLNVQPKVDNYLWNDAPCDFVLYFACEEATSSTLLKV